MRGTGGVDLRLEDGPQVRRPVVEAALEEADIHDMRRTSGAQIDRPGEDLAGDRQETLRTGRRPRLGGHGRLGGLDRPGDISWIVTASHGPSVAEAAAASAPGRRAEFRDTGHPAPGERAVRPSTLLGPAGHHPLMERAPGAVPEIGLRDLGVTPEINAMSTIIVVVTAAIICVAWRIGAVGAARPQPVIQGV